MALFIIGLVCSLGLLGYLVYFLFKYVKKCEKTIDKKTNFILMGLVIGVGITTILSSLGLVLMNSWSLKFLEFLALILGSFVLGFAAAGTITAFVLHYWSIELDKKIKKVCKTLFICGFIATILGLWLFSEGIANQDIYPLFNRIDFTYGLTRPGQNVGDSFGIQFYGIIIVCGALVCFFITDHYTYKKFGEHGLIDTLFIVAFLAGVIGSRLWYCLILEPEYFLANPGEIVTGIVNGGLAIQGGALGGAIVGIAFVLIFRKYIDVRFLMDVAIPTILIAQAIGRWGNFLNNEVHGLEVSAKYFEWLPTIIRNNMAHSSTEGMASSGNIYVPLFIIESLINFGGFFFIRFFLGKVCKFRIGTGYQASAYFVWYGTVRAILEPFRAGDFEYTQSIVASFIIIGIGVAMFIFMFTFHNIRMKKGIEDMNGDKIKTQKA